MLTITPNYTTKNRISDFPYKNQSFMSVNKNDSQTISSNSYKCDSFDLCIKRITDTNQGLSGQEIVDLKSQLKKVEQEIKILEVRKLEIGRLLDYDRLKKSGFSNEQIKNFVEEDDLTLENARMYTKQNNILREYMFGYPANMTKDSALTEYLRVMESKLPLMNNCGDPYDSGNYMMDSKKYEQLLLNRLFEHFGLDASTTKPWGYITTGGSESNKWGIHNGLRKFPNGRVYYSEAAHYSVGKSVKIGFENAKNDITLIKHSKISLQPDSEKINTDILLSQIRENWKTNHEPAIVVLTFGTTKTGAIDDIEYISKTLKSENIPHYIHLDAALFGGIAKNQKNAPNVPNIYELGIDSVAISLHKYFGNHDVKSVVITKEKPNAPKVDYIGQYDSTTAGSRTFNPFSSLQRVSEVLNRTVPEEYNKNIQIFENLLKEKNISYSRAENSNIFVINKPSEHISKKYQLSDFDDNGVQKSHIIIFPYHKENIMLELVKDLVSEGNLATARG